MFTPLCIANEFMILAQAEDFPIRVIRLQKLLYLAFGKYFDLTQSLLFEEQFKVTRFGPVLPSIKKKFLKVRLTPLKLTLAPPIANDSRASLAVYYIWSKYGHWKQHKLSELLSAPNSACALSFRHSVVENLIPYRMVYEHYQLLKGQNDVWKKNA